MTRAIACPYHVEMAEPSSAPSRKNLSDLSRSREPLLAAETLG